MKFRLGWRPHRRHHHPQRSLPDDPTQNYLDNLLPGQTAQVVALSGGRCMVSRMVSLGFTPGAMIQVIQNFGHGPLIVNVRDTRVALGRFEARSVVVKQASI